MRCARSWLFLLPICFLSCLAVGWVSPAGAAEDKEKTSPPAAVEGEIQFEKPQEPCEPKAKEEECPTTFGPIITDTAIPIDKGRFAVQPTFGLSFITDGLTRNWRRVTAGGNLKTYSMDWKFTYGLMNNLEVFAVIPYVHNWAGNVNELGPNGERAANFGGLGDINLTFKYRLVEETKTIPTVTALFATDFPTGHFRHLNPGRLGTDQLGGGAYAFTTGLNMSKWVKPLIFYANVWYTMQTAFDSREDRTGLVLDENGNLVEGDPVATQLRNYPRDFVTLNLAAEYPLFGKWVALLELTSYWSGGRLFGHRANLPAEALISVSPGIEYMATDKFSVALGLNIDFAGKNTDAAITPLLSMVYAF
ncbi:MAG: transporter [Syntrophobacterales bacterium]|nr:transporter [Syntrophobacterales bacterium]